MQLELEQVYADLWRSARTAFLRNAGQLDPLLQSGAPDARRGLTVIFRPGPAVAARVGAWLAEMATDEPAQYCYTPAQLHVTVLSLFTAIPDFGPYFARLPRYLAVLDAALATIPSFTVAFRGVTASLSTVMVQGFPANDALERARAALRTAIAAAGLGDDLDRRYRLVTAHLSALRLRAPLTAPARFVARLEQARDLDFGVTQVDELLLVANDWYMTPGVVEVVRCYSLTSTQPVSAITRRSALTA